MRRLLFPLAATVLLGACASVPRPLDGEFAALTPQQVREQGGSGQRVRWGGEIIQVDPASESTCFEILGRPLGSDARPLHRDEQQGRFLACRAGFFDPEVYTRGREVTVTGRVDGSERRKVGEYDYLYPRVAADAIYLWPKASRVVRYYDPYPWGFGPWNDPFWSPAWGWWGPPQVIVVHPKAPSPPPKPGK